MSLFGDASGKDCLLLDRRRRAAATRHMATRASFYQLLFPTRPPSARWEIDQPARVERDLGPAIARPDSLYDVAVDVGTIAVSQPMMKDGLREYWLRAQINDSSGDCGGGDQCCWTSAHVRVIVK